MCSIDSPNLLQRAQFASHELQEWPASQLKALYWRWPAQALQSLTAEVRVKSLIFSMVVILAGTASAGPACPDLFSLNTNFVHQFKADRNLAETLRQAEELFQPYRVHSAASEQLQKAQAQLAELKKKLSWRERGLFKYVFGKTQLTEQLRKQRDLVNEAAKIWRSTEKKRQIDFKEEKRIFDRLNELLADRVTEVLRSAAISRDASWLQELSLIDISMNHAKFTAIENGNVKVFFIIRTKSKPHKIFSVAILADYETGKIHRAAVVNNGNGNYERQSTAGYNLLKAGSIMNRDDVNTPIQVQPLEKAVAKLKLKTSAQTIEEIQKRGEKNPKVAVQVQQVLNFAQSSKRPLEQSLMESYLYYMAYGEASLYFMPPTHWLFFHFTHSSTEQVNLGLVFMNLTHSHFSSVEEVHHKFQDEMREKGMDNTVNVPLEIRSDPTELDVSNLGAAEQKLIREGISEMLDPNVLARVEIESGISALGVEPESANSGGNFNSEPNVDANSSVDTSADSSDGGGGGGDGGGGD